MRGECQNGALSAVSVCPPQVFPSGIQPVRKVGRCCEQAVDQPLGESIGCPKNESGQIFDYRRAAETIGEEFRPTKIPWQVRFTRKNSSGWKCDGVILGKKWFLAPSLCFRDRTNLVFSVPDHLKQPNVSIADVRPINGSDGVLSMVSLNVPFVTGDWTKSLQPVNLPWNADYCKKLIKTECRLLFDRELVDPNSGAPGSLAKVIGGGEQGERPVKIEHLETSSTPYLFGSGGVAWFEETYFLAGIHVGDYGNKTAIGDQDEVTTGHVIPICPYLDELKRISSEN
jgi:hypothetical protein